MTLINCKLCCFFCCCAFCAASKKGTWWVAVDVCALIHRLLELNIPNFMEPHPVVPWYCKEHPSLNCNISSAIKQLASVRHLPCPVQNWRSSPTGKTLVLSLATSCGAVIVYQSFAFNLLLWYCRECQLF